MPDFEQDVLRARQAAELLEHPLLVEAFAALEREVIEEWKASPARDEEGREKLWIMLRLSEKVRNHLQNVITTGKMAEISLRDLNKKTLLQRVGLT